MDNTLRKDGPRISIGIPLVIAVTGHRDLVPEEVPALKAVVRERLEALRDRFPNHQLTIMSALAEGADLLVAEVAVELQFNLIVPLPKELLVYREEIASSAAREKFDAYCDYASDVFTLDQNWPAAPAGEDPEEWQNNYSYAQLGMFLCGHCHILLALWDGFYSDAMGGTAQVVHFHHDNIMSGAAETSATSQAMLVDDESDLVLHIVCSRQSNPDGPNPDFDSLDWFWFTKDEEQPRAKELLSQHDLIFRRASDFILDARAHSEEITANTRSLIPDGLDKPLPTGTGNIDDVYCIADWLAMHYQKLTLRTLLLSHLFGFSMGFMFILFSDLETLSIFLWLFLSFFAAGVVTQVIARKKGWQRRYIDYRTLAEGLRVQFFWAVSGVVSEQNWRYAHDAYLQGQAAEIGWIRNIMRVAGLRSDATRDREESWVSFVELEWVGDETRGQLGYFKRKAKERLQRNKITQNLGRLSLVVSVLSVVGLLLATRYISQTGETILILIMGSTLLTYAVREGYSYATGTNELVKQYDMMQRIYHNAYRRLSAASSLSERRQILLALGQSALDENSDWLQMNRERSMEKKEVWRVG